MTSSPGIPTLSTASLSTATIIDLGSYQIKVGESSDTRPAHSLYSFTATIDNQLKQDEGLLYSCQSRPIIQNGQVADIDGLEQKLRYLQATYYPNLFGQAISLLQPYYCAAAERQQISELLFEKFNAKALHFGVQEAAAVMGAGCTTGVCCDFGFGKTSTVPVVDGRALESAGNVCYLNGQLLGQVLVQEGLRHPRAEKVAQDKLERYVNGLTNFGQAQLGGDCLQYFCAVSETPLDPLQFEYESTSRLALPDGAFVEVGRAARLLPECFFNTAVFELYDPQPGHQFQSIQYQFVQTVSGQPAQVRKELVQNVVLSGGVSQLPSLQARLRSELDAVYSIQALTGRPRFAQCAVDKRDLPFFGGAVVSSLSVFGYFVSSAQEWKEEGAVGVERRRM